MAGAKKSLAAELMEAINYYQMKAHRAYISESDAVSISDFTSLNWQKGMRLKLSICIDPAK